MNRFLCSRSCRCCVCLILVLVLLISWSPIRAQASVLGGAALLFGDDAIAIILAVLGGLGVCAAVGSESSDLETRAIARNAMDAMEEAGNFVKDGALSLYSSATAAWSYAVSTDMVQWLHDWLFDSQTLTYQHAATIPNSYVWRNACLVIGDSWNIKVNFYNKSKPGVLYYYDFCVIKGTTQYYSKDGTKTYNASDSIQLTIDGVTYNCGLLWDGGCDDTVAADIYSGSTFIGSYGTSSSGTINFREAAAQAAMEKFFAGEINGGVSANADVNLGTVATPGTDIETEYGDYIVIVAPNGVPDTGGDGGDGGDEEQPKIPVLPVPYLPPSEIPNVPQKDIWKGNKVEIDNPDTGDTPDPTTGTDTDDPDSGSNNPTTPNPDPGTNPGTGVPSDIGDYQIDLKKFFPFCIPFDLYDFFSCLAADPVAPVIEWVIPLPGGDTYPLEIDLSAFDGVAQLLRRLQLLLFCVGLAFKTRDLIKG